MRDILMHHHIFKNAGSSFSAILDHNFGRQHLNIEAPAPWGVLPQSEIVKFVLENSQIKAISSHTARIIQKQIDGIRFHPMLFLRHPLDRVGSVYSFECRQPSNSPSPGAQIARTSGIREYVEWRLKKGNGAVIRNFQVAFISGREIDMRHAEAAPDDLKRAMAQVDQMKIFGLVEFFEASVHGFKKHYEELMGPIEIQPTHQNQSAGRKENLDARIDMLKQELGTELYAELLEKNSLDMELYNAAKNKFLKLFTPAENPLVELT